MILGTITNILIFFLSTAKSVYDLFLADKFFKNDIDKYNHVKAFEKKTERGKRVSTYVFMCIALISGINLWEQSMNRTQLELEGLKERVLKIEDVLFPPGGGPTLATKFESVLQKIDFLYGDLVRLNQNKVNQVDFEKIIEKLEVIKQDVESIKKRKSTRTVARGA